MRRIAVLLLFSICPALVLADSSSLSFNPPASDYSIIFLGNLFGMVDGVLHGTGSQIMGTMFGVFNSAVLALGGMIIMYTLMVSTMNTAHEGQMLGQKWSSIWIPVRSTLGLALLIPKASGYCLMQIFVMWIVVQGVGAADKIWEAGLSYLNRGGVIIQAQTNQDPTKEVMDNLKEPEVLVGARSILIGQVCMLGLQKQLEAQRERYLQEKNQQKSCDKDKLKQFCQNSVPDFISSVNAVTEQSNNKGVTNYHVDMPNFKDAPYSSLNGICGKITWVPVSNVASNELDKTASASEKDTTQMSRALAIQQMYLSLANIARIMVNNDPQLGSNVKVNPETDAAPWAKQQFGVPYTVNYLPCGKYSQNCTTWGAAASSTPNTSGVLFTGNEFQVGSMVYKAVMMPILRVIQQLQDKTFDSSGRKFIAEANSKGWIMAGSYFFDLVKLNGNAMANGNVFDKDTGLSESTSDPTAGLLDPFKKDGGCNKTFSTLCEWFEEDSTKMKQVITLIGISPPNAPLADMKNNPDRAAVGTIQSSTVNAFINNSLMMQIPGQPGLKPLEFAKFISFTPDTTSMRLEWQDFPCGGVTIIFFKFCLGWMLGNIFYNIMFLTLYNTMVLIFADIIKQLVLIVIMIPLQGMSDIFKEGVATLSAPGVNPVVALANMGTQYINFGGDLWLKLLIMSVTPIVGVIAVPLMAMAMPLVLAWLGIMVGIGITTSYYIPILPYMIFTFASIAWLICVIEAMVAAPIVALGVTHPEGHEAFGKGEAAIMILMNVFLRPSMMIIGYISAIALSYVGVWILNAGYDHAISYMQGGDLQSGKPITGADGLALFTRFGITNLDQYQDKAIPEAIQRSDTIGGKIAGSISGFFFPNQAEQGSGSGETKYTSWAGIYAFFFSILIYTTMYLIIVQKAFTLITQLPDKVLRWIGGQAESAGGEAAQWGEEMKSANKEAGGKTQEAQGQVDKQLGAHAAKITDKVRGKAGGGGGVSASPSEIAE